MHRDAREFDIVIYGATGFTGRQAAHYLASHAPPGVRLAIAGRNANKLHAVLEALPARLPAVAVVVADSESPATVDAMVARTRVLATTAGPFARYGDPVVDACVAHDTDYVDITGETPWVRRVIDRHHASAAERGVRIVPFCGFDSIPSDLGSWFVVDHARRALGQATREVRVAFQLRGGLNGGTLASMLNLFEQGGLEQLHDPLLLNPADQQSEALRQAQPDVTRAVYDDALGRWTAPFFMAPVNSRVVRRSAALAADFGEPWGEPFLYRESMLMGRRAGHLQALAMASGLKTFERAARLSPVRRLLQRVGPEPGEGPAEDTLDKGFFRASIVATTEDGQTVRAVFGDQGDPGNRATVKMLCESALCLAVQRDELPGGAARGGVLTPATALGGVLLERLRAAGMRIETVEPR